MTELRRITEADYDEVAAMHVKTWQTAYEGIVPAEHLDALDPAAFAARRRSNPYPDAEHLIAIEDGRIVAFVTFGPDRSDPAEGELYGIYVLATHAGHGIGRRLLEAARAGLSAAGFPSMRLWVLEENHAARGFYERMGLTPDGARKMWTPRGSMVELPELRYATPL
ncbi:GNAT family N-acetyltransferase [Paractinoplanes lichenicola]|uniref:GNAT family N-acetyltransferase n=1 Tax=Paractinoplanes lichenicola TaxID=2802976 RepID=A0ABS1VFZ5_9ACTN|nr:GNAT family N-acetyltransferase [Actinoplanes lichenicola]MBL7253627.1 GNAT family N-acetyltransferase [Actinoplanes lichenicola]